MKRIMRIFNLLLGCFLIAIAFNLFIVPYQFVGFGVNGIAALLFYETGVNPALNIFIINSILLLICSLFTNFEKMKIYLLPSILVPCFIFATQYIFSSLVFTMPEDLLTVITAGVLSGYGYSLIYKQGYSAGMTLLLEEIIGQMTKFYSKIYSWVIDVILLIFVFVLFGYQLALYSFAIIFITKYMVTKARFNINDSKMFYIITTKEKEVKHFIIHDLKYELTELDVKGGFSKRDNKIIFSVISSSDYYKLKEGIKIIDPHAFIAITDTYDVVNRKAF